MTWLKDNLRQHENAEYTVVIAHIPYWIETVAQGGVDPLHDIFKAYGVDGVFTGHYHVYFSGEFDGILYTGIGSSGGGCDPGLTGLKYHFAWVTLAGDEMSIAPVKMGSVLPWDEVTAAEFNLTEKIAAEAMSVEKVRIGRKLSLPETDVTTTLKNLRDDVPLRCDMVWDTPSGWTVRPDRLPVEVAPGESHSGEFTVICTGPIYPVPTLKVRYPYAPEKDFEIEKALPLARTVYAPRADQAPAIDGSLNESVWQNPTTDFFAPDGSPVITDPVSFYFAWDADNLYLAAMCQEAKMGSIVAAAREHDDAVFGEDCVGYFFQPDIAGGPVYQIYFNAVGTPFDQKISVEGTEITAVDREWNGDYEVATTKSDGSWSIEVRVPLAQLGASGETGKMWALNFRRKQRRLASTADWQVPISYLPDDYGLLEMR